MKLANKSLFKFSIQDAFFFIILTGLSIAFYKVLKPFLMDVFAAVILSHGFYGIFLWFQKRLKVGRKVSSLLTAITISLIIAAPMAIVTFLLSLEVSSGYQNFRSSGLFTSFSSDTLLENLKQFPIAQKIWPKLVELNLHDKVGALLDQAIRHTFEVLKIIVLSFSYFLVQLGITLYLVYFLLLDGQTIGEKVYALIPISREDAHRIFSQTMRIVEGTILGTVVVGILEGTFAGILFFIAGIPSPVTWGVAMAFFSMLPIVGATTVVVPWGAYFAIQGKVFPAILLLVVGVGGIALTSSLLKPKLVGERTGLHPAVVILSMIGGVAWLGMIGFFIGPLLAALFIMVWTQFSERYKVTILSTLKPEKTEIKPKTRKAK
jgi:predicted PurR-regulated permease PerM